MKKSKSVKTGKPAARTTSSAERFALALGGGLIESWPLLPQKWQKALFEAGVIAGHHDERDELLREQLAAFLHVRHPRTARRARRRG